MIACILTCQPENPRSACVLAWIRPESTYKEIVCTSSLRPGWAAKIDDLVGDLLDAQPLGQRRRQHPGTGDGVVVVEGDIGLVQHHLEGWHRKGRPPARDHDRLAAVILPGRGTLFTISPSPPHHRLDGSRRAAPG